MSSPGAEAAPGPLCAALLPHASTPSFCTYQYDGGVCRQGIEGHVKLIRSLIQVNSTMSFKKDAWLQALKEVAKHKPLVFRSKGEMSAWQAELHKRLKTMCRHASQCMIKDTPPKWFKALALPKPVKNAEPGDGADG
ncbi:unnamed protein product, partial [Prorocentrum cordatum]